MELVDLRMGALKRTKSSMVYTLGKLRKELENHNDGRENPNVGDDDQSAPYAAFLVDNCETAARNVILACSDVGWGNLTGEKLKEKVKLAQTRASEFHKGKNLRNQGTIIVLQSKFFTLPQLQNGKQQLCKHGRKRLSYSSDPGLFNS